MLKTASIFLLIGLLFGAIYAAWMIVSPQTMAESTLEARTQLKLKDVQDPGAAGTILTYTRHLGVFAAALTIAMFYVLYCGFKKGQVWAWWAFFLVGTVIWGYGLVLQAIEGDALNLIGHIIGFVLLYLGLLLSINVFFPKRPATAPKS